MAIIKCKMCGGDILLAENKTFGTCEYCGSTMTLPKISDDQRAAAFNRGNHFRRMGEFDKALAVYERIVAEDDADAEAHWCCALCRFGIEYVEDPASYEWIPTCHRASFDSFFEDVDYLAAVEYSDGVTKRQYQKDAAKIAEVQRGILATSQNEEPFDVFICYKDTDEAGNRTIDSTLAQDIYYQLTGKNYRVFFSRITLENKAGVQYEPYIFAALNSAKVMVVVGTKPEHYNAVWVKNEWSRFLALMRKDRSKLLLPCYRDMNPYDLPEQLSVLQSYDMGRIGFIQDLIHGISKVLNSEKASPVRPPQMIAQQVIQQSVSGTTLSAQIKRGQQALEDHEWEKANEFFDRALDMDAECAEAFWGKGLATAQCANGEELVNKRIEIRPTIMENIEACEQDRQHIEAAVQKYIVPGYLSEQQIKNVFSYDERRYPSLTPGWRNRFAEEQNYWNKDRLMSRAVRYANEDVLKTISDVRQVISVTLQKALHESEAADEKNAIGIRTAYKAKIAQAEEEAATLYKEALSQRQEDYNELCREQAEADTPEEYDRIAENFENEKWSGLQDCSKRAKHCRDMAERLRTEANQKQRRRQRISRVSWIAIVVATMAFLPIMITVIIPGKQYSDAEAMLAHGDYDGAIDAYERLGNFRDSAERASQLRYTKSAALYREAENLLADGDYDSAIDIFTELGDFQDCAARVPQIKYAKAEALLTAGDKARAAMVLATLGAYKDAGERAKEIWNTIAVRKSIGAGQWHTVGLRNDGTVLAAGYNRYGDCDVSAWSDIVAVDASGGHTIGLRANGTVVAVGENEDGKCNVSSWSDIVSIAAGGCHTVGLRMDGTVVAVGDNKYGQCNVSVWSDIIAIAAGFNYTLGLRADGTVVAVGENDYGECNVSNWSDIVAVASGGWHTLGLKMDGTVVAVGRNEYGECDVSDWFEIVDISAGKYHTVGLRSDGTVIAKGDNYENRCTVSEWSNIIAVNAGALHTTGLRSNGTVLAVGYNDYGQCNLSDWTDIKVFKE